MFEYWIPIANVISTVVLIGSYVVAFLVINCLAEGRARVLGIVATALLAVGTTLGILNGSLAPWLMRVSGTGTDLHGLGLIGVAGIGAVGLVLLARAVVVSYKSTRAVGGR